MRTIAIVFALAVVGAAAPAAPNDLGHLFIALLGFSVTLLAFLGACLVSGWLLAELRRLVPRAGATRAHGSRVPARAWPVRSVLVGSPPDALLALSARPAGRGRIGTAVPHGDPVAPTTR